MTRRILWSVITLASILFLPYWIYVPVLFIGVILIPFFWEGMLLALIINVIHGSSVGFLPSLVSPLPLSVLIVLVALLPIRESLRYYV